MTLGERSAVDGKARIGVRNSEGDGSSFTGSVWPEAAHRHLRTASVLMVDRTRDAIRDGMWSRIEGDGERRRGRSGRSRMAGREAGRCFTGNIDEDVDRLPPGLLEGRGKGRRSTHQRRSLRGSDRNVEANTRQGGSGDIFGGRDRTNTPGRMFHGKHQRVG
jgi:hypothetical protein